jgi:hypothetical protein
VHTIHLTGHQWQFNLLKILKEKKSFDSTSVDSDQLFAAGFDFCPKSKHADPDLTAQTKDWSRSTLAAHVIKSISMEQRVKLFKSTAKYSVHYKSTN